MESQVSFTLDMVLESERSSILRFVGVPGGNEGEILRGTIQDVAMPSEAESRIRYLAFFDSLTGLGNRAWLEDCASNLLEQTRRRGGKAGVIFLDLDGFKNVNDSLGHHAGDELLCEVATRLRKAIRASDVLGRDQKAIAEPSLSRFGGDEFMILLGEVGESYDFSRVARRIQELLLQPT